MPISIKTTVTYKDGRIALLNKQLHSYLISYEDMTTMWAMSAWSDIVRYVAYVRIRNLHFTLCLYRSNKTVQYGILVFFSYSFIEAKEAKRLSIFKSHKPYTNSSKHTTKVIDRIYFYYLV